jgi:hypothetical protein
VRPLVGFAATLTLGFGAVLALLAGADVAQGNGLRGVMLAAASGLVFGLAGAWFAWLADHVGRR